MGLIRLRAGLVGAGITVAILACGGETVAPSCESLVDGTSCSAQPACVWLHDRWSPNAPPAPGGESRRSACFESARTGVGAVCRADETRVVFFNDVCWSVPCTADVVYDNKVAVCWKDGR